MSGTSDIQHDLLLLALGNQLYTSPTIADTATVLDVGTGTGTWACQLASKYPRARVYGIDLHQVTSKDIPGNVIFETVDVMTGFPFNTGTFDFIHSRLLVGGITDWPKYLENLFRITKRGGYVECIELELRPSSTSNLKEATETLRWSDQMAEFLRKQGLEPNAASDLKSNMEAAGFLNVQDKVVDTPIVCRDSMESSPGKNAAEIAQLTLEFSKIHFIQWLMEYLITSGAEKTKIERDSRLVLQELSDPGNQLFFRWHFCTGQKSSI